MLKNKFIQCLVILFFFLTFTTPVLAAEDKKEETPAIEKPADAPKEPAQDNPGRFAPDFCDFELTFPEAPMQAQRCVPTGECYTVYSYTVVYDLQTTIDISVNCTPSTPANFKRYTQGVMKAALAGMIEERNLDTHDISFKEDAKTKSAALTGTGKTGTQDKIYTGQLWVGQNSVLTVQAELIGSAHEMADSSFGDILQSLTMKEGKQMPVQKKKTIPAQGKNQ